MGGRHRRGRPRSEDEAGLRLEIVVHDGTGWALEDHLALQDYLEAHALLPEPMELVAACDPESLGAMLARPGATLEEKKRALVFLAHHRSARAREILRGQLESGGGALARFVRFAFEEASQWAPAAGAEAMGNDDRSEEQEGRGKWLC